MDLLEIYGEDHPDFKEAKLDWQIKKGLKKHFHFLDTQGPKAEEVLERIQPNQGDSYDDDFSELK